MKIEGKANLCSESQVTSTTAENELSMLVSIQTQEGTSVPMLNQSECTTTAAELSTEHVTVTDYTTVEEALETSTLAINLFPFLGRRTILKGHFHGKMALYLDNS